MLREAIAAGSALGQQAAPLMERGQLVPDDLLIEIVRERLSRPDSGAGYLLDGFPRTVNQAQAFARMYDGQSQAAPPFVFLFELSRDEILRRLSGRRMCPSCQTTYHLYSNPPRVPGVCDKDGEALVQRDDDKETAVARRLEEYESRTAPLVSFYDQTARFHRIDAASAVDDVFAQIMKSLGRAS